jgi:predicted alpha/beta-hydrolase family hydrolase
VHEITALSIAGYVEAPVPNLFFRQGGTSGKLAVIFPGLRYSCDMPLLYYSTNLLLQHGVDVLQLHTDYTQPGFQSASRPEQAEWMFADALAGVRTGRSQGNYTRLILAGKSIGTLVMASLAAKGEAAEAGMIWLTPLLHQPQLVEAALRCKSPALFAVGTGDSTYDPAALARIRTATGAKALILENANHSLEIPGDAFRSLHMLNQVMQAVDELMALL